MTRLRPLRGFATMLALFLIVTVGAVAGYLLTISSGQIEASAQEEKAARAYQAAYTGVQWAAFQILRAGAACAALNGQTISLGVALAGYSATVECTSSSEDEGSRTGANAVQLFHVTATGCNSATCPQATPTAVYVERQLHLTLAR